MALLQQPASLLPGEPNGQIWVRTELQSAAPREQAFRFPNNVRVILHLIRRRIKARNRRQGTKNKQQRAPADVRGSSLLILDQRFTSAP
jgi:hypothetical protein